MTFSGLFFTCQPNVGRNQTWLIQGLLIRQCHNKGNTPKKQAKCLIALKFNPWFKYLQNYSNLHWIQYLITALSALLITLGNGLLILLQNIDAMVLWFKSANRSCTTCSHTVVVVWRKFIIFKSIRSFVTCYLYCEYHQNQTLCM